MSVGTFFYEQLFETPKWAPSSPTQLAARTVIVTGSNSGLGLETAIRLASLSPKLLILAVRTVAKGETARTEIARRSELAPNRVQVWELDMASFASVSAFAARCDRELDRLDVVCANAAMSLNEWVVTKDGWEQVLQVSVIATGLLSVLLLPLLARTATLPLGPGQTAFKPHLTIVSSTVHGWTGINAVPKGSSLLADFNNERGNNNKDAGQRYELSKLLDIFLGRKIASFSSAHGVVVNTVNPGYCNTGFGDESVPALLLALLHSIGRTADVGARNFAYACTTDTPPGAYVSVTSVRKTSRYSRSRAALEIEGQLWDELVEEWLKLEPTVKQIVA